MRHFTPGPWETDEAEHDQPYLNIRIRSADRRWHNICTVSIDDAPVPEYNSMQKANARLIASAPELVEALHDLLTRPTDPSARSRARAVLEKTGREISA